MKKILLTICLLIGSSGLAHAETLSLTTTIPAPINTYDRIRIVPSAERLESYCDIGSFYVNENNNLLYKCASLDADGEWVVFGKVWEQNGDLIHLADTVTSPELKRFAIGTSTTELKLKLDNDGGIMAKDTLSIGNAGYTTLPDLGAGTRLLWYPKKAAFRAGRVDGSQWNDSNIGNYSMAFGYNTTASGVAATVGGGQSNSVAGDLGVVGGGQNNSIDSLTWAGTIGGGETNVISNANYAVIGAGADNTISTNTNSVILGGSENLINSGSHNTIAGGVENTISGFHSTIGGGWDNQINGNYGATLGGKDNVAIGNYISMGGGEFNYAEGNHIVIIGGRGVAAAGNYVTAGGGEGHEVVGNNLTLGGGSLNIIYGDYSTLAGGTENYASGDNNFIGAGSRHNISATSSSIAGGYSHRISGGSFSTILGGDNGEINNSASYTILSGGDDNIAAASYNFIAGRNMQTSTAALNTFVWGVAGSPVSITAPDAFIVYSGNVGLGVTAPAEKLHIDGSMNIANGSLTLSNPPSASGSPFVRENATGILGNDLAETFETSETFELGDVVQIDPDGMVKKSTQAYSTTSIGIVSYKPAVLLDGSQTILAPSFDKIPIKEKVAVALAGRVLCKVTTENGPIEAGDLLVSSSLEGHAMKAGKYEQSFGTIFAKALEDFNGDKNGEQTGAIKVLITVQ